MGRQERAARESSGRRRAGIASGMPRIMFSETGMRERGLLPGNRHTFERMDVTDRAEVVVEL
jgi:hypothetical protein